MYHSLQAADAPVGKFAWGNKTMDRQAANIDRKKGAPETFESIIART
jgi:hypothetical protein